MDESPKETEMSLPVSKSKSVLVGDFAIPSPNVGSRAQTNSDFVGPLRKTQSFADKIELVQIYEQERGHA